MNQPNPERIYNGGPFKMFQRVKKKTGASWQGRIVGVYFTDLTPIGYCVESERERGSVQIYPAHALEAIPSHIPPKEDNHG